MTMPEWVQDTVDKLEKKFSRLDRLAFGRDWRKEVWTPERIQAMLRITNWKKKSLAKRLGVSPNTITNWLQGKSTPTAAHAEELSLMEKFFRDMHLPDPADYPPERIFTLRIRFGYSQQKMAEWAEVSIRTWRAWERGDSTPTHNHLAVLQDMVEVLRMTGKEA